jgi:EipB-like
MRFILFSLFFLANLQAAEVKSPIDFVSHRAEYKIELHEKKNNGLVQDVKGTLVIELRKGDHGWNFTQESTMIVYFDDGHSEQYVTQIKSFESEDGQQYKFDVRSLRNGTDEEFIEGQGYISPTTLGSVTYTSPSPRNITLPKGTLFPLTHLRQAITTAKGGDRVFPDKIVFDGASDAQAEVDVNTIITPASGPKLVVDKPDLLKVDKMWSLQMAIFSHNSKNPEPDYEITQTVLESGVIASMLMNYTDAGFTIKLTLSKVDLFTT